MQVKSQIARPATAEVVAKGKAYRVFGAAWAGDAAGSQFAISTYGGMSYAPAKLLGTPAKHAWRLWEFSWKVPDKAGKYALMARATDADGERHTPERGKESGAHQIRHLAPG